MPATAKLKIGSLDDTNLTVCAQYNPRELQVNQAIEWHDHTVVKRNVADLVDVEFGSQKPETMQVELLFDGFENQGRLGSKMDDFAVMNQVLALKEMASPRNPDGSDADEYRPHFCVVTWGDRGTLGMPPFRCVIESLAVKYQAFGADGTVLRATVTVGLRAADPVVRMRAKKQGRR